MYNNKNTVTDIVGQMPENLFSLTPKPSFVDKYTISNAPSYLSSLPLPKQTKQFNILIKNIDQLLNKMCITSLNATFENHSTAIAKTLSFRSDLLHGIRNVMGLDFKIPNFTIFESTAEQTKAVLSYGYLNQLRLQIVRQIKMFNGSKVLVQSILSHNIINYAEIADHMFASLIFQHFERGYVWQQYNQKAAELNFCNEISWIRLNAFPLDPVMMQAITCSTIDFTPSVKKPAKRKIKRKTPEEMRELKLVQKAAEKAMKLCRETRAMREVYNDLDLPHMQSDPLKPMRSLQLLRDDQQPISVAQQQEIKDALEERTIWSKITDFIRACASTTMNFAQTMVQSCGKIFELFKDMWSFIGNFFSTIKAGMQTIKDAAAKWETLKTLFISSIILIVAQKTGNGTIGLLIVGFYISFDLMNRGLSEDGAWFHNKISNLISRCNISDEVVEEGPYWPENTGGIWGIVCHLVVLAGISLFAIPDFFLDENAYSNFFSKICSKAFNMAMTSSLSNCIKNTFSWIIELISTNIFGFGPNFSSFVPQDIDFFIAEATYFYHFDNKKFRTSEVDCDRIKNLFTSIPVLLKKYNEVRKLKNLITDHSPFIYRTFSEASVQNPSLVTARNEPVTIVLRGAAGVGKTKLVQKLASLGIIEAGKVTKGMSEGEIAKAISQNIYARKADNDFWDGYQNQAVTVYDDFGQMVDSVTAPNREYIEIIGLGNTFQMPLTMAHLTNKGNVFFDSKMLILTTNKQTLNPVSLTCAEALHRRLDFAFEVRLKQGIDSKKFLENTEMLENVHTFHVWDPKSGNVVNEDPMDFDAVVDMVQAKFNHIREKNKAELADTNAFVQRMLDQTKMQCPDVPNCTCPSTSNSTPSVTDPDDAQVQIYPDLPVFSTGQNTPETPSTAASVSSKYGYAPSTLEDLEFQIRVLQETKRALMNAENRDTAIRHQIPSWLRSKIAGYANAEDFIVGSIKKAKNDLVSIYKVFLTMSQYCYHSFSHYVSVAYGQVKSLVIYQGDRSGAQRLVDFVNENYKRFKTLVCEWKIPLIISALSLTAMFFRLDKQILKGFKYLAENMGFAKTTALVTGAVASTSKVVRDSACYLTGKAVDLLTAFYESGKSFMQSMKEAWYGPEEEKPEWYDDWVEFYWEQRDAMLSELGYQDPLTDDELTDLTCSLWLQFRKMPRFQSGKSRTPTKKINKRGRAIAQKRDTVVQQAWSNHNAQQISSKVLANTRMMKSNGVDYNIFMLRKTWFVMNRHTQAIIVNSNFGTVEICNSGCTNGTIVNLCDIQWHYFNNERTDIVFGQLPPRLFSQVTDITSHIIKKSELDALLGKSAVLIIPSTLGATQKFGTINSFTKQEMKNPEGMMVEMDTIEIRTTTVAGDCGGVYMVDAADNRKIFGIHTAGAQLTPRAFATPIYAEMFDEVIMQHGEEESTAEHLDLPMIQRGNGNVSFLGYRQAAFNPTKTQIIKTRIHNEIFETVSAPAKLGKFNDVNGPMLKALEKQFGPVLSVNDTILDVAKNNYLEKLEESPPRRMTKLTFEAATQGREGSDYYRGINRARSAGYPYCLTAKGKGKTDWFGTDEWIVNEKTIELRNTIEEQIRQMERGVVQEYIFLDTLKDETRPIEKVAAGKTRVFAAAPMDFIIVFRMYYLDFLVYMMENRIYNESAVGIRTQSDEWTTLYNRLKLNGDRVVAGDFSNYDGTLHPKILWAVYDIIDEFYDKYEQASQEDKNVRECLWHNIVNSYHLCGNWFYQLNHSQPSGNPATAILNSMYNSIACRYTFYTIYDEHVDFNEYVSMIAYGDDNVLNISDRAAAFNQQTMAEAFKEIGMTYTDELKTGLLCDKTLEETAFLKRSFAFDKDLMYCFAPLHLPSILEAFNWIKKTDCEPEIMKQIAENALVELSMHPPHIFHQYTNKIRKSYLDAYNFHIHALSYKTYRMKIITGKIYNSHPTLDWA